MAETIAGLGCEVTIVGRELGTCCKRTVLPFKTVRFRMIFKRGFLFYKFINIRILFHLLMNRYGLIVANDLDTLLPGYLVSKIKNIPLVFDSHEYFTGVPELAKRHFRRWIWKSVEKMIMPGLVNILTVSGSIANLYKNEYQVNPVVIRNCARNTSKIIPFLRNEINVPENVLLLIYQGRGINIERGGEELIEALQEIEGLFLLIIGGGDVYSTLQEKVVSFNLSAKVRFVETTSWHELIRYTKCADAGLSLDKDTNINYRFSLPNKLFDYLSSGIPVIAGDLPEVSRIISEFNCGLVISKITPENISKSIIRIRDDKELLNKLKANAVIASQSLNWDTESIKVKEFYKGILK
jgi:glycosyltransferase involved in cell wall biosynthesis